jgi:hypothetical protein
MNPRREWDGHDDENWDGDDDEDCYRSKNGIKQTDDPIPGAGQTGHCGGNIYR